VDYNPLACAVARANCRRNPAAAGVRIVQADLARELPDTACDLVLVNLYKGVLERLFVEPRFWRGRHYIVSSFLPSMEADLLAALPPGRLRVWERRSRENWRLWVLENAGLVGEGSGC
jgi:ribosomal protein L11 methyltransferase